MEHKENEGFERDASADCQSAIQPIANRRYRVARTGSPLFRRLATGAALPSRPPVAKNMSPIKELDAVALTCDLPAHRLARVDVGTAVLVHGHGVAFEVEFTGYDGHTVALLTFERNQVRPLQTNDIPHARALVGA